MRKSNKNILSLLDYTRKLLYIADKGDMQRTDDGCGVLYGVVRDSAYKIREMAEKEVEEHKKTGKWDEKSI